MAAREKEDKEKQSHSTSTNRVREDDQNKEQIQEDKKSKTTSEDQDMGESTPHIIGRDWRGEPMNEQQSNKRNNDSEWEAIAKRVRLWSDQAKSDPSTSSSSSAAAAGPEYSSRVSGTAAESSSSAAPAPAAKYDGMDIDHISREYRSRVSEQWIRFMRQAGQDIDRVKHMFDDRVRMKRNITGWIAEISSDYQEWRIDRKEQIQSIAQSKPLLMCGKLPTAPVDRHLAVRVAQRQHEQGRHFWLD